MTGKENTRPTVGAVGRAVESGTVCKTAHASTKDDTTIGGCGQMGLLNAVLRRELVHQLSPETAVNVLLACWDFWETGEKPTGMSPIESIALASLVPDAAIEQAKEGISMT